MRSPKIKIKYKHFVLALGVRIRMCSSLFSGRGKFFGHSQNSCHRQEQQQDQSPAFTLPNIPVFLHWGELTLFFWIVSVWMLWGNFLTAAAWEGFVSSTLWVLRWWRGGCWSRIQEKGLKGKAWAKMGLVHHSLGGALIVMEEEYFLQTAMPLILAKLYRQKTPAWVFLAFPCICKHYCLPLPSLTCLLTHQLKSPSFHAHPGSISELGKGSLIFSRAKHTFL